MVFTCKRCGEELSTKQALVRHLQKTVVCPLQPNTNDISREAYVTELTTKKYNEVTYSCKYCQVQFNTQSSMYRHIKICKKKPKDEASTSASTSVSSLSLQTEVNELRQTVSTLQESLNGITSLLAGNSKYLNTPQVTNNISNVVINNTIVLNNFGNENISYLTPEFLSHCLLNPTKGLPSLIESIHYNPEVPENHNIRFKSWKRNVFEKYDDSQWKECDASNTLDGLIRKGYRVLNTHYTEHYMSDPAFFEDESKQRMYERFRFLSDTTCNEYYAVKRELRVLIKERTMYILAPPDNIAIIEDATNEL